MELIEQLVAKKIIPTCPLNLPLLKEKKIEADVLRLDAIHQVVSGNKWFKLKYYLSSASEKKIKTIVTYGGAYSNHILATAFAASESGFKSVGIIRGERPKVLSDTLKNSLQYGMQLEFLSREDYKNKTSSGFQEKIIEKFTSSLIIPEGGAGEEGVRGSMEILELVDKSKYSTIACAAGTGTMFAGLANASLLQQFILGISVVKSGKGAIWPFIERFVRAEKIKFCEISDHYHFGGYAKKTDELISFMNQFYDQTGIPTDFVYTAKMFYAILDLAHNDFFVPGSRILVIHSGGLQGNHSLPTNKLKF